MQPQSIWIIKLNNNFFNFAVKRTLCKTEKYCYLNFTLPTDSKSVKNIKKGDVMLFGSNCLVIFYKSFTTSYSYTKIGHIENPADIETALGRKDIKVVLTKSN